MTAYSLTGIGSIQRNSDGAFIPVDPHNLDYAAYLVWVAAGNTAASYVAPPPAPLSATPYQFRAGLTAAGIRTQVETAVAASTDQNVKDAYQFATSFVENDSFIVSMSAAIGLTADQVHAIFVSMQGLAV
jgi:hypothetical protein